MSELLTLDQTAAMLGKSRDTLLRWHKTRGFPIHRINHQTAYCDRDEVAAWVKARAQAAQPAAEDAPPVVVSRGKVLDLRGR